MVSSSRTRTATSCFSGVLGDERECPDHPGGGILSPSEKRSVAPNPGSRPGGTIVLAPHDPAWAIEFARESTAVRAALDGLFIALHHIGSTAIPTTVAKPVIDMLGVVPTVQLLDAAQGRLESLGYEALGEFGIPGRRYFRRNSTKGVRTHQLHAFAAGSSEIQRHLDFRDYLRAHAAAANEYSELKHDLAQRCAPDTDAYTLGKTDFIRRIESHAAAWRRSSTPDHEQAS